MVQKVLVTGAGGYIGSVLTRLLTDAGYHVRALDRFFFGRETLPESSECLEVCRDDVRWFSKSRMNAVDAVIDLAALSNDPSGDLNPAKTWEINHAGRVRVAHLAKTLGVNRYILPSSCSIYGFQEGILDEGSPAKPLTTYAQANLRAEEDILELCDESFCVVAIRQATVYGLSPRMRFDLAINGMVKGFFSRGKIPILRDGSQWRPFIHVRDTARAMQMLLEAPVEKIAGEIFNVGSDEQNIQIMSLARTVADAIGVAFDYEWYGDPDHRSYKVSFAKFHDLLGFKPAYSPADGAREIYEALQLGNLNAEDPRTITVKWYAHLLEMHALLKEVELRGDLL